MEDSCKDMTMFITRLRLYQFEVMPLWLIHAPAIFLRMVNKILHRIPFSRAYLDNVVILSKLIDDHHQHVEKLFVLSGKHNLELKLS